MGNEKKCITCRKILMGFEERGKVCNKCLTEAAERSRLKE